MVSEETYAAVVAENAQVREQVAQLEAEQAAREQWVAQLEVALAQALERVSALEAAKKGRHTRMVLTSLFETWRAQGHHPLQACRRLLHGPLPQF